MVRSHKQLSARTSANQRRMGNINYILSFINMLPKYRTIQYPPFCSNKIDRIGHFILTEAFPCNLSLMLKFPLILPIIKNKQKLNTLD